MINFIKDLFANKSSKTLEKNDFSSFFTDSNSKEKAKIIRQVLREATEEQKDIMRQYEKTLKTQ